MLYGAGARGIYFGWMASDGLQLLELVVQDLLPFIELADELKPALRVDLRRKVKKHIFVAISLCDQ